MRHGEAEADRSARLRRDYARAVTRLAQAGDPRIEEAFAAIPREPFAGPLPWFVVETAPPASGATTLRYRQVPEDDPAWLYEDVLVALDPDRRINIGQPSLHALCLDRLAPRAGERAVHVGAGSGYYTAILAHLLGPTGRVCAYEIDPVLAGRARQNLARLPQVDVLNRSGLSDDLPKADVIYVSAGLSQPAHPWLDALRPGGRLLFPLQPPDGAGAMLLVTRPDGRGHSSWPARFLSRASFIPCATPRQDEWDQALAAAFARGGWMEVRSLHLGGAPDGSAWFEGQGWWLSTREAC